MFNDPKYCIEINLIQQTPMIHFQATKNVKSGFGPRASEVKPKLDRFAALWYKRNNHKDIPDEWMVEFDEEKKKKPEHCALNYVLRITAPTNTPDVKEPDRNVGQVYFGNMGDNTVKKLQIVNSGPVSLYIRCFIPGLKALLEDCIDTFFLLHNFGTRQDKGLGGFIPEGMTSNKAQTLLKSWMGNNVVGVLDYSNHHFNEDVLNDKGIWIGEIGTVYRLLKSGLNVTVNNGKGPYVKSALTEYFLGKNINGEKKAMKTAGVAPIVYTRGKKGGATTADNNKDRYIRGLFGYGKLQNWFSADSTNNKITYYDKNNKLKYRKDTIKISPSEDTDIERIPSPLLFKVVNKCIFIIPQEITVYGQLFEFTSERHGDGTEKIPLQLMIPTKAEFDMNKFMCWFIQWLDKQRGGNTNWPNFIPHIFMDSKVIIKRL